MATLLEKYREATGRWVTAPSGIEYRIRGIAAIEYGALLKAMPALVGTTTNGDKPSDEEINSRLMTLVSCGVTAIRWQGEESFEVPSPTEFPAQDVAFVAQSINEASGIAGSEAEAAGRSL